MLAARGSEVKSQRLTSLTGGGPGERVRHRIRWKKRDPPTWDQSEIRHQPLQGERSAALVERVSLVGSTSDQAQHGAQKPRKLT